MTFIALKSEYLRDAKPEAHDCMCVCYIIVNKCEWKNVIGSIGLVCVVFVFKSFLRPFRDTHCTEGCICTCNVTPGRPKLPEVCKDEMKMQEQTDMDAVQPFKELRVVEGVLQGPHIIVGAKVNEVVVVDMSDFDYLDKYIEQDVKNSQYLQLAPKDRLLDLDITALLTPQAVVKNPSEVREKQAEKRVRAKAHAAFLKHWRTTQRKRMKHDKFSRQEMIDELIPSAKTKKSVDPGQIAMKNFMKGLHKVIALCWFSCNHR